MPIMRKFSGIDLNSDRIFHESTTLALCHMLEMGKLGERLSQTDKAHLKERITTRKPCTITDTP